MVLSSRHPACCVPGVVCSRAAFLPWKSSVRYSLSVETETEIALDSGLKGHLLDLPTAPPQKEVFWFGSDWFGVVWFGLIFGIRH